MTEQSGRSLVEIIGVMAVGAVMTVSAIGVYNMIRNNQVRTIAAAELKQVVENTKLLLGARGSYNGLSVEYLIKAGALSSDRAPLGDTWSVEPSIDGLSFSITLNGLSTGECEYFITAVPSWATRVVANGYDADNATDACFTTNTNQVVFHAQ